MLYHALSTFQLGEQIMVVSHHSWNVVECDEMLTANGTCHPGQVPLTEKLSGVR